ncbi:hypothetical protein P0D88_31480 [Paraburkholderia sp. RL18-103-BIB-C]|uniref:hypothetical protein n=1 Tax=Paraburkholderia sp. RL18-103-BIB-C TaxID=3031637 RepID=UPI0038B93A19
MASAGSLIFELAADVSRLRTDMGKAQTEIMSALDSIRKSTAAEALMTGAEYAVEFAKGFAEKIMQAVDQADALGKLSQRIGTTTEELSALAYAGQYADVSTDDLTTSFKALNKALLDARDPTSDSAAAIQALGLNVKTLQNEDPGKAFEDIAEAMSGFKDGAEKAAVATQLFGKQGQALIPLLDDGKEGIAAARKEAEALGLIISTETATAMADLNDDFTRMGNVTKGAAMQLAQQLQPAIEEVINLMKDMSTDGTALNTVLKLVGETIKSLISDVVGLGGALVAAGKFLSGLDGALTKLVTGQISAADAAKEISGAWAKGGKDMEDVNSRVEKIMGVHQKGLQDTVAEMDAYAASQEDAGKKTLIFTATVDANAAAHKKAKKEVDDYAQMLGSLSEQLRKAAADGDQMQELMTDPKFAKMTKEQQQNLIDLTQAYITLTDAQKEQKQRKEEEQKASEDADAALIKHRESLRDFVDTQMDSIDPTIKYIDTITKLVEAQKAGYATAEQFAAIQKKAADELQQAGQKLDPMADQLKQIQSAIEGFGKKSSDAFVNFIFNTQDASTSFSEMVSSMLEDLAKMLVYQNVMKPMFDSISGGFGGGGWASSLVGAIGRMSGGPVSPGQLYQVNELPGRKEFFIPNVAGNIVTDAGAGGIGSSGPNVQVNVHLHKDSSETQDTKADNDRAAELGKRISAVVKQTIANEKRTGGLLATP